MYSYGQTSESRLKTVHPCLQKVFREVIKYYDCAILCGHRDEEAQNSVFNEGLSKVKWPDSKHNQQPSLAVDAIPYPVDWADRERIAHFAGFVLGVARGMGIKLRWGGDWDGDGYIKDHRFVDMPHFELVLDDAD